MAEETRKQVNVDFTNFDELLVSLEKMADDDGMNKSQLVRKLIRQERDRRAQLPLPFPETQPKKNAETRNRELVAA